VTFLVVEPVVVAVSLPGLDVTVYPVMAEPPFDIGADQLTTAAFAPEVAITPVGAPGTVEGILGAELTDAAPVPLAFLATTLNV